MIAEKKLPTIGFLGTGAIVRAMVDGFCQRATDMPYPIVVSGRRAEAAKNIAEQYPSRVTAACSMQECLDRSDWVVVAVLPQASEKVIRSLRFRENHKVINVMFGESENDIRSWMNCSVEKIIHMTPGTFLATYSGPIIQCPPDNEAEEIFSHIGKMIVVNDRYHAAVLETYAGLFAPIFAVMDRVIDWAVQEECVPEKAVTEYVTNMFAAVCQEACAKNHREVHYMATVSTPGGINMQALALLQDNNAFSPWHEVLPPLLARTAAKISKEKTNRQ